MVRKVIARIDYAPRPRPDRSVSDATVKRAAAAGAAAPDPTTSNAKKAPAPKKAPAQKKVSSKVNVAPQPRKSSPAPKKCPSSTSKSGRSRSRSPRPDPSPVICSYPASDPIKYEDTQWRWDDCMDATWCGILIVMTLIAFVFGIPYILRPFAHFLRF